MLVFNPFVSLDFFFTFMWFEAETFIFLNEHYYLGVVSSSNVPKKTAKKLLKVLSALISKLYFLQNLGGQQLGSSMEEISSPGSCESFVEPKVSFKTTNFI